MWIKNRIQTLTPQPGSLRQRVGKRPYIPMYPFLVLSYQTLQGVARMYPCIKEVSNTRQGARRFSLAHLTANSLTNRP